MFMHVNNYGERVMRLMPRVLHFRALVMHLLKTTCHPHHFILLWVRVRVTCNIKCGYIALPIQVLPVH